jgi:TfoX/Sxy family transcriptional regulator of competence genes
LVASDSFAKFLREELAPLGRVTMGRMFGRTGVFCHGRMFGIVADNTLYFRVDDHNQAAFKEASSFSPLSYQKKGCTIRSRLFGAHRSGCLTNPMRVPGRVGAACDCSCVCGCDRGGMVGSRGIARV